MSAASATTTAATATTAGPGAARFGLRASLPRLSVVLLFAVGMAYVEAAAVLYLRIIFGGVDPVGTRQPLIAPNTYFLIVEVGREAATMVMLATVGWLAGRGWAGRLGAFIAAFGAWDIFYYVFLWLFSGWPASPLAPDILFLIPLPWWGPVLAPTLIATVMVVGGGLMLAREAGDGLPAPDGRTWALLLAGAGLCLVAFMWGALLALPRGLEAAFAVRNAPFPWPLYGVGLGVGVAGVARMLRRRAGPRPA